MLLLTASAAGLGLESGASPALAGGGCHQPTTQDAAGDAVFMEGMCFTPTVLRVQPGTKVTFLNKDETIHQVNGINWAGPGTLSKEALTAQMFDQPGMYPYACTLHPGMVGVVVVGDGRFVGTAGGAVNASLIQPEASPAAAVTAAVLPSSEDDRPVWLYAGLGVLAGVAATIGVVFARR